jgi:protein-disulfide isomerase
MAVAGLALAACSKPIAPATGDDMTMGDPAAKVKLTEYASVTCPHCAAFAEGVLPQIKRKYIDTGKVHYTFREILTAPSEVAAAGFLTARCAGEDKYFTVIDAIFNAQPEMFSGTPPLDVLRRIGKEAGLSDKQFDACVTDEKALTAISDRVEKNSREGEVEGTPTFAINGKKVKDGEMSFSEFEAFYNDAVKAPAAAPAPAK